MYLSRIKLLVDSDIQICWMLWVFIGCDAVDVLPSITPRPVHKSYTFDLTPPLFSMDYEVPSTEIEAEAYLPPHKNEANNIVFNVFKFQLFKSKFSYYKVKLLYLKSKPCGQAFSLPEVGSLQHIWRVKVQSIRSL